MRSFKHWFVSILLGFTFFTGLHSPLASADQVYPNTNIVWHPGHYAKMFPAYNFLNLKTQAVLADPNVTGLIGLYKWNTLEVSKGVYNFTKIETDLGIVKAAGKQLIVLVVDKTFSNYEKALPNYLWDKTNLAYDSAYNGGHVLIQTPRGGYGYFPQYWNPAVNERAQALYAALGAQFNGRIEAFQNMKETATTIPKTQFPAGYSDLGYRNGLIGNINAVKAAFPNTVTIQSVNFAGGKNPDGTTYVQDIINAAKAVKSGITSVNNLPYDAKTYSVSYQYFSDYSTSLSGPVGVNTSGSDRFQIDPKTGVTITTDKLADFAINTLRANYVSWEYGNDWDSKVKLTIAKYKTVLQP